MAWLGRKDMLEQETRKELAWMVNRVGRDEVISRIFCALLIPALRLALASGAQPE